MRNRGGQFYLFDAFFAATILLLGIGFLVTEYTSSPQQAQTQLLLNDITGALTQPQLADVFNTYTNENFELLNEEYTPAQQIHSWWYNNTCGDPCRDNATALAASMLTPIAQPPTHGINITLNNGTHTFVIFEQTIAKEKDFMIVNHQILLTDTQSGDLLGPDNLEVRIWQ